MILAPFSQSYVGEFVRCLVAFACDFKHFALVSTVFDMSPSQVFQATYPSGNRSGILIWN